MHKQRQENIRRQETIHNPEFTPKINAKKQPIFHRKPLAGQKSANHPTRLPHRPLISSEYGTLDLSDEAVRNSAMYKMLEKEMEVIINRQQYELTALKEIKQEREKQLSQVQRQQFNTKMQIWELKNEKMELKESIREEKEEADKLTAELGLESEAEEVPPTSYD